MAGAAALAACAGRELPATRSTAPIALGYVAALPATNPEARGWLDALEDWNGQQGPVTVRLEDAQAGTDSTKLKALLAAGTIPDLMMVGYRGDPADLYSLGAIVDLDAELKGERDWGRQRADIYPGFLESSLWAGRLVAIPGHGTCQAMIYNPDLLQKAGAALPRDRWTWSDFLVAARKAMAPPDVWGLDLNWSYVFWAMWVGAAGGRPLTRDNRRLTLTTPPVLEATTFMLDLVRSGIAPPESSPELFVKGQTVFEHQGSYRLATLRQNNATFGVVHMPLKTEVFVSSSGYSSVVARDVPAERRRAPPSWPSGSTRPGPRPGSAPAPSRSPSARRPPSTRRCATRWPTTPRPGASPTWRSTPGGGPTSPPSASWRRCWRRPSPTSWARRWG